MDVSNDRVGVTLLAHAAGFPAVWRAAWWVSFGLVVAALGWVLAMWLRKRIEPPPDTRGHYAPSMWRLSRSIPVAVVVAVAATLATYMSVVAFGDVRVGGTTEPATVTDLLQAAIAVLSAIAAMIGAVFLYRRSRVNLADSRRSDAAAYQQRFVDASTLLGNEKPAVRVAGVIALAALARDSQALRQDCVDVLCSYMRLPLVRRGEVPAQERTAGYSGREIVDGGENEVRNSLVKALVLLLLADPEVESWVPIRLDLRGAVFGHDTYFRNAVFTGHANFGGAIFTDIAHFGGAKFKGQATFTGAKFMGDTTFEGATFSSSFRHWYTGEAKERPAEILLASDSRTPTCPGHIVDRPGEEDLEVTWIASGALEDPDAAPC